MIIDDVKIHLIAGRGGNGCGAFLNSPSGKKIPWGGNGSRGASILLKVNYNLYDLSQFRYRKVFVANNGNNGLSNNRTGRCPADLILAVPPGTLVRNSVGDIIKNMVTKDSIFLLASGGGAGQGNYKHKLLSCGLPGEVRDVVLDYRIPNDVAILGFPNTGKTSLFNFLTARH